MSRVYRRGSIDVTKENLPLAEAIEKGQVTIEFLYAPEDNPVYVLYYDPEKITIDDMRRVCECCSSAFGDNVTSLCIPFEYCLDAIPHYQLAAIKERVDELMEEEEWPNQNT